MKIEAKKVLVNLKGEPLKNMEKQDFTVGEAIANILLDNKTGGKAKMFVMSQKFYTDEIIDVDLVDLGIIKKAVEETESFNNLVNGQLIVMLSALKDEKKPV